MTVSVHPSAVVEQGAEIGDGCQIGPFCHIGSRVRMGRNNVLHAHVVIDGHTSMGDDNEVFPFACLGKISQDLDNNPMLGTALAGIIGYDKAAAIVKKAYEEGKSVKDVAAEMTSLSGEEIAKILDPRLRR